MRILSIFAIALLLLSCNSNQKKKSTTTQPVKQAIVETEKVIKQDSPKVDTELKTEEVKPVQTKIAKNDQPVAVPISLNINDMCRQFEKTPQRFVLDNAIDTILVCNEGTILTIKAGMFVKENGEPVNGKVTLKVKEYYKLSDILLADLSTTSDGEMLETGGMLHLEAIADGVQCKLKKGKALKIEFPYEVEKENMQLFGGNRTDELMNWQLFENGYEEEDIEIDVYMVVETMPEFRGGTPALFSFISNNISYPAIAKEQNIQGTVIVQFVVDEDGSTSDYQILRGVHPSLDNEALRVLRKMPKWIPGNNRGEKAAIRMQIPINFVLDGGGGITENNYIKAEIEDNTLTPQKIETLSRYAFMSTDLGWINCDRFITNKKTIRDYYVNSKARSNSSIKIVFHKYKSILPGFKRGKRFLFRNVPIDEEITIVAFKYIDQNQVGLAIQNTKTKYGAINNLEYKPVAIKELQKVLENINAASWN